MRFTRTECTAALQLILRLAANKYTAVLQLRLQLPYSWVYGCVTTEFTAGLQQRLRLLKLNVWLRYN